MCIEVNWDNEENKVVRVSYSKYWEWDEIYYAENMGNELAEAVPYEIAVIHDMSRMYRFPANALTHIRALMLNMHPRMKYIIFVGMRPLVRVIWNTFAEIYTSLTRERVFIFVDTLDEARDALYALAATSMPN
jgi:hypothetical protein